MFHQPTLQYPSKDIRPREELRIQVQVPGLLAIESDRAAVVARKKDPRWLDSYQIQLYVSSCRVRSKLVIARSKIAIAKSRTSTKRYWLFRGKPANLPRHPLKLPQLGSASHA